MQCSASKGPAVNYVGSNAYMSHIYPYLCNSISDMVTQHTLSLQQGNLHVKTEVNGCSEVNVQLFCEAAPMLSEVRAYVRK